jgi:hypothetical protein
LKGFYEKAFGDDRYDTRREGRKHLEDTERVKRGEDDDQALNIDWVQQTYKSEYKVRLCKFSPMIVGVNEDA